MFELMPWRRKRTLPAEGKRPELFWDRFLDEFRDFPIWSGGTERPWSPSIDVSESEKEVTVTAELPGLDPAELDIRVDGRHLTIRGEKREEKEEKEHDYHLVERRYGSFSRSLMLPAEVNAEQVEAGYKNGVLTIRLPKKEEAVKHKIHVKAE